MTKVFIFGKAAFDEHFTNRLKEQSYLENNFTHGINTILISPRRWGKTSLVHKVAHEINQQKSNIKVVLIDAFICKTEEEFLLTFASAIIKQTSNKWQEWIENSKTFLAQLAPRITVGNDPINDFELSLDFKRENQSKYDILNLPQQIAQNKKLELVICIDEFQQITEYPSNINFQKNLRSIWQLQKNVSYCLYGSKKHILSELFSKQSMPFYNFGALFFLEKITKDHWVDYISDRFASTNKQISPKLAEKICTTVDQHSSYVQQLAWLLWINTKHEAQESDLNEVINDLIIQNSIVFNNLIDSLSSYQLNFLRALSNNVHTGFTKQEILKKYNLGTSANITRIKKALEDKEIIDINGSEIYLADPVFKLYLKQIF